GGSPSRFSSSRAWLPMRSMRPQARRRSASRSIASRSVAITWNRIDELPQLRTRTFIARPPRSCRRLVRRALALRLADGLVEEGRDALAEVDAVVELHEPVALVGRDEQARVLAALLERGRELHRLLDRDARVVEPVPDEERDLHLVHTVDAR